MSLEKFLDILINSRLFFTNLSNLTDQYEGTVFDTNIRAALALGKKNKYPAAEIQEIHDEIEEVHRLRSLTLVNSWSMRRIESYALWKIYVGQNPGVAIRTTVTGLRKAINTSRQDFDEDIAIAKVKYSDSLAYTFSRLDASTTKKKYYDFEEELRLLIFNYALSEGGWKVPYDMSVGRWMNIDPDVLIQGLFINPLIAPHFRETIASAITRIAPSLKGKLRESQLADR